jgi:hypothetical protein
MWHESTLRFAHNQLTIDDDFTDANKMMVDTKTLYNVGNSDKNRHFDKCWHYPIMKDESYDD